MMLEQRNLYTPEALSWWHLIFAGRVYTDKGEFVVMDAKDQWGPIQRTKHGSYRYFCTGHREMVTIDPMIARAVWLIQHDWTPYVEDYTLYPLDGDWRNEDWDNIQLIKDTDK
jgi:hypothetical protein